MATRVAIAQREERAIARLQAAAQEALAAAGVPEAFVLPSHKQPELRQAVRLEAVADLVETMAEALQPPSEEELNAPADEVKQATEALLLARIEAIEGIGPKTMDLIRKGLVEPDGDSD